MPHNSLASNDASHSTSVVIYGAIIDKRDLVLINVMKVHCFKAPKGSLDLCKLLRCLNELYFISFEAFLLAPTKEKPAPADRSS